MTNKKQIDEDGVPAVVSPSRTDGVAGPVSPIKPDNMFKRLLDIKKKRKKSS